MGQLLRMVEQSLEHQLAMPLLRTTALFLRRWSSSSNRRLTLGLQVISHQRDNAPVAKVKVGSRLEPLIGSDPDGAAMTVQFEHSGSPTVLLVLRPGCHWCELNMPNWKTLIREKGQNFRFVAVSLSTQDFKEYVDANGLAIPAVFPVANKNPILGKLTGTPQTIVVGPDGVVRRVWFGAFAPEVKRDVEGFFGLSLPVAVQAAS